MMSLVDFVSIAKDIGFGLLALYLLHRSMQIFSQADKRNDENTKSLIDLNGQAVNAVDKLETTVDRVGVSQDRSVQLLEKAEQRAEQTLQRHIENGDNILEGNRIQREIVQQLASLGLNFANYNLLVDGTVSGLSSNVAEMNSAVLGFLGRMDGVESALRDMRASCQDTVTKDHLDAILSRMVDEFNGAKAEILERLTTLETVKTDNP